MRHGRDPRPRPVFRGFGPAVGALALIASALAGAPITTTASTAPSAPAAEAVPNAETVPVAQHAPIAVTVRMTEFRLDLPKRHFTPGTYTFTAVNAGRAVHSLSINGPGVANQGTVVVQPGRSATLNVTLHKGRYDIYCPVGTHAQHGMRVAVTVS